MRTAYKVLASSLLVVTVLAVSPTVSAHGNEDGHDGKDKEVAATTEGQKSSTGATGYTFITPEGGSMSVLTRRAIQLHDQEDTNLSLSPAQAAFVEATLVQELGNRYLEIGERFTVPKDRLAALAKQSQSLDTSTVAAWQEYADGTDFAVSQVSPESTPASSTTDNTQAQAPKNENDAKEDEGKQSAKEDSSSLTPWGVFLAILAISTAVYVANPRRKPTEAAAPAKSSRKPSASRKPAATTRKRKK